MKKIAVILAAALSLSATVPVLAQMTREEKDMCLLASQNCLTEVDTIQKRIRKIQSEIRKGKKVYSADELKKLEHKLKEAKEILQGLEKDKE